MKSRVNIPNIPFISMKVNNFYKIDQTNADQPNPGESSPYALFGESGGLNCGMISPVQDFQLLATTRNLEKGNISETTRPGYIIKKNHFEEIVGPSPMNLQNAYN